MIELCDDQIENICTHLADKNNEIYICDKVMHPKIEFRKPKDIVIDDLKSWRNSNSIKIMIHEDHIELTWIGVKHG